MAPDSNLIWYVSYGANMCLERFSCYLQGGTPPGSTRTYFGARDKSAARLSTEWKLPGQVVFGGTFFVWDPNGCGAAFYVSDPSASSIGRAWLITRQQFMDLVAQENGGEARDMDDALIKALVAQGGEVRVGGGAYNLMVKCGERDGVQAWTFTTSTPREELKLNKPSEPYLRMLRAGVMETTGMSARDAYSYLSSLPGNAAPSLAASA